MLRNFNRGSKTAQRQQLTSGNVIRGELAAALERSSNFGKDYAMEETHQRSLLQKSSNKRTDKANAKEEKKSDRQQLDPAILIELIVGDGSFPEEFERKMITPFFGGTTWNQIKHAFWPLYQESGLPDLTEGQKIKVVKKVQDRLYYGTRSKKPITLPDLNPDIFDPHQWAKLLKTFNDITDQLFADKESATLHDAITLLLRVPMTKHLHPVVAMQSNRLRGNFNTRLHRYNERKKKEEAAAYKAQKNGKSKEFAYLQKANQRAQADQFEKTYQISTCSQELDSTQTQTQQTTHTTPKTDKVFKHTSSIVHQMRPIGEKLSTIQLKDSNGYNKTFKIHKETFYFSQAEDEIKKVAAAQNRAIEQKEFDYDTDEDNFERATRNMLVEVGAAVHLFTDHELYKISQRAVAAEIDAPFTDYAMFQKFQARAIGRDKARAEVWRQSLNPQ